MNITVIGGGTVGSLITFYLQTSYPFVSVTNIHSSKKDIIGVGEGITGALRYFLFKYAPHGKLQVIDDVEFFNKTNATIKLTIKYEDWCKRDYWSAFEPNRLCPDDLTVYDAGKIHYNEAAIFNRNTHYCKLNKTGFLKYDDFETPYGYHFDGNLISKFFLSKCNDTKIIDDEVINVKYKENGNIDKLITKTGLEIETDFVIDCSGFHRVFQQDYNLKMNDVKSTLMNRAIPFLVPIEENEDIDVFTTAKAMQYGWMWKIPVGNRYGMGYVFNKDLISNDNAITEIETILNRKIEPIKVIDWNPAVSEKIWHKNVLMLGLSSNFIEPLEATSIHGSISSFLNFLTFVTTTKDDCLDVSFESLFDTMLQDRYNLMVNKLYSSYESFIQQHYLNPKYKTEFWNWYADKSNWTDHNQYLVKKGNLNALVDSDFGDNMNGIPGASLQYPTLLDMELIPPIKRGYYYADFDPFAGINNESLTMKELQKIYNGME